jgi:hypothetical protein
MKFMQNAFIVQFQEACNDAADFSDNSGTQTLTNVRAEQMDADPDGRRYEALEQQNPSSGTMTSTAVKAEQKDEDRAFSSLNLIPSEPVVSSGTQTLTRMKAEGGDTDFGEHQMQVIPPCFSS